MLIIQTEFGNFGHPRDLLRFIKDKSIMNIHVNVQYCFKEVFEKDMSLEDVQKWAAMYISPISGTLQDAIKWLKLGGE